jgi:hypothetical protein
VGSVGSVGSGSGESGGVYVVGAVLVGLDLVNEVFP